jgi:hypothetical protein
MADRWFSTPETGSNKKLKRSRKLCGGRRNSRGIELEIEACIGKARGRAKHSPWTRYSDHLSRPLQKAHVSDLTPTTLESVETLSRGNPKLESTKAGHCRARETTRRFSTFDFSKDNKR